MVSILNTMVAPGGWYGEAVAGQGLKKMGQHAKRRAKAAAKHSRPRGKAPKNMFWDYDEGGWVPDPRRLGKNGKKGKKGKK